MTRAWYLTLFESFSDLTEYLKVRKYPANKERDDLLGCAKDPNDWLRVNSFCHACHVDDVLYAFRHILFHVIVFSIVQIDAVPEPEVSLWYCNKQEETP